MSFSRVIVEQTVRSKLNPLWEKVWPKMREICHRHGAGNEREEGVDMSHSGKIIVTYDKFITQEELAILKAEITLLNNVGIVQDFTVQDEKDQSVGMVKRAVKEFVAGNG